MSKRGIQSIQVNGPACVIEVKDGKWLSSTPVAALKGGILKSDSGLHLPFNDESNVQVTVLPAVPGYDGACAAYLPLDKAPYFCMRCVGMTPAEKARYEEEEAIPCCP